MTERAQDEKAAKKEWEEVIKQIEKKTTEQKKKAAAKLQEKEHEKIFLRAYKGGYTLIRRQVERDSFPETSHAMLASAIRCLETARGVMLKHSKEFAEYMGTGTGGILAAVEYGYAHAEGIQEKDISEAYGHGAEIRAILEEIGINVTHDFLTKRLRKIFIRKKRDLTDTQKDLIEHFLKSLTG